MDRALEIINLSALVDDALFYDILQEYYAYIAACGWTDIEFDNALLEYIDNNWEDRLN